MVYKFHLVSDEVDNFRRVIAIDSDDTFLSLRNAILDSVNYTKDQIDSFYLCNDDWEKEKEVTLTDMGSESDEDIWLMEDTKLGELIEDEGQKLLYVFDYLTERAFFIEMKEIVLGKKLLSPVCEKKMGKAAPQFIDEGPAPVQLKTPDITDMDMDFLDEEGFNDDELDPEGYNDLSFDDEL